MSQDANSTPAGWYPAQGDPPGTQRYWDGAQWTTGPEPIGSPAGAAPASEAFGSPATAQDPYSQAPVGSGYEDSAPFAAAASYGAAAGEIRQPSAGGPIGWWKLWWARSLDFSGRSRRAEFWWASVVQFVLIAVLLLIGAALSGVSETIGLVVIGIAIVLNIAAILPGFSSVFRRLHDTGRSAWWMFISLVPFVGSFILLWFYIQDSHSQRNQYGPSPKYG